MPTNTAHYNWSVPQVADEIDDTIVALATTLASLDAALFAVATLAGQNAGGSAGTAFPPSVNISMGGFRITDAQDPVSAQDVATRNFVVTQIASLIGSSPDLLATLDGIAAAIADDPDFASTITTQISGKLSKSANLSDLTSAAAAKQNLQLGSAADADVTDFEAAGAAGTAVGAHVQAVDPHGDRNYADGLFQDVSDLLNAKQDTNAGLSSFIGLNGAANTLPYFTDVATFATTPFTLLGRSLMAASTQPAVRTAISAVGKGELVFNVVDYGAVGDMLDNYAKGTQGTRVLNTFAQAAPAASWVGKKIALAAVPNGQTAQAGTPLLANITAVNVGAGTVTIDADLPAPAASGYFYLQVCTKDSTQAFADAAAAASAAAVANGAVGASVFVPRGNYWASVQLTSGVTWMGEGTAATRVYHPPSGSTGHSATATFWTDNTKYVSQCNVQDLMVLGNPVLATGTKGGIRLDPAVSFSGTAYLGLADPQIHVRRVMVRDTRGVGFYVGRACRGGSYVDIKVLYAGTLNQAAQCAGAEIQCTDSVFTDLNVGATKFGVGIKVTNAANHFVGGKSWYSFSWNWWVTSATDGSGTSGSLNRFTDSESQDGNQGDVALGTGGGWFFDTFVHGCFGRIKSNGDGGNHVSGTGLHGVGFHFKNSQYMDFDATLCGADGAVCEYIITLDGTCNTSRIHVAVDPTATGQGNVFTNYLRAINGYAGDRMDVQLVQRGNRVPYIAPTTTGTFTPNPFLQTQYGITMTGNITIANPAVSHPGQEITFVFLQDATGGRTVSWGTAWDSQGWAPRSAANASSSITFVHFGTGTTTGRWTVKASSPAA